MDFRYGAFTLCDSASQQIPLPIWFITARTVLHQLQHALATPVMQRRRAYTQQVSAPPVSLAATQGISIDFFSSRYLDGSVPWVSLHCAIVFTQQ